VIPIVFAAAGNPVGNGLVASLARPGGNVTGLSNQSTDLAGKQIECLREMVPGVRRLAILANIETPIAMLDMREVQAGAGALGLTVVPLQIRGAEDIVPTFAALEGRADAVFVAGVRTLANASAENEFGGPETGARSGPRRQELAAEETVFRVSVRLSDRKGEWIQRGTEKVSLPGLPGGGGVHLRTRLHPNNSLLAGNWQVA